jgi:energy-coupling factor transporter ATP-binding protein EcfA2
MHYAVVKLTPQTEKIHHTTTMQGVSLDFSRVQLYGRQEELKIVQETARAGEVLLLYGYSGSGKSRVVEAAITPENHFVLASGKFDQLHDSRPFSALLDCISNALNQACKSSETKQKLRQRLESVELEVLYQLMPVTIHDVVGLPEPGREDKTRQEISHIATLAKVGHAFEVIIEAVASLLDTKLVLFLDDLQFGDAATMDLLVQLATSQALKDVAFVFAYRDNEVNQQHPWANRLTRLNRVTKLEILGLPLHSTEQLLQDLTRREDCHDLAVLIQQKTFGNPFFTLQMLDMLQQKHIIYYSAKELQWEWDISTVQKTISLTPNVIDVIVSKLKDLTEELQLITHVAACLGQRFDRETIQTVLPHCSNLTALLQTLQEAHIIEAVDENPSATLQCYKWGHDQIQQAAYSTIPQPKLLHWQVGVALKPLLYSSPANRQLLTIVHQLNQGIGRGYQSRPGEFREQDQVELAVWNVQAAQVCFQQSAYAHAIPYVDAALGLLVGKQEKDPVKPWTQHYSTMLELSKLAIKAYFCVGRLNDCADQIQQHYALARTLEDTLPIYPIEILMTQNGIKRSIDRGIEVLNLLGDRKVQRKPGIVTILKMYWRIRRRLKKAKDLKELLFSLPVIQDHNTETFFDILGNLTASCWTAAEHMLMAYLVFLGVEKQLDHGFVTAFPFALLTSVLGTFLEYDLAFQMAEAVLAMVPQTPREDQARSEICVRAFGMFRLPIRAHTDPTLRAHKLALEVGDNLWAGNAGTNYIQCCLHAGHLPLGALVDDAKMIHQSVEQLQVLQCLEYVQPIIQAVVNLNSTTGGVQLDGEFAKQDFYKCLPKDKLTVFLVYHTFQLMLGLHFQDMALCRQVTDIYWKGSKEPDGLLHSNVAKRFYYGLAAYSLAGCGGKDKRKQYRRGKIMERQLKALAENGCVNCVHLLLALVAERLAQKRRSHPDTVKEAFDKAIMIGMRAGFVADSALTCHRAALYFRRKGEVHNAVRYTEKSLHLYARWEAWAVVSKMCNEYGLQLENYSSDFSFVGSSSMKRMPSETLGSSALLSMPFA